jgi:hypothetical protein
MFARWRRRLGEQALEDAWGRANYRISGLLLFPIAAVILSLAGLIFWLQPGGTFSQHKLILQIVGTAVWLGISFQLGRRFSKFKTMRPPLQAAESNPDRLVLWKFRLLAVGSFAVACMVGYLLHRSGFHLI